MLKKKGRGVRKWESAFMQKKKCLGFRTVEGGVFFVLVTFSPCLEGGQPFFSHLWFFLFVLLGNTGRGFCFFMGFLDCWVTNVLLSGGALILTHNSQGLGSSGITYFLATWTSIIIILLLFY